tara:strand:- start:26 stop:463 length:438 start_codon:yes stop_codon:yes gene_type:complete
MAAPVIGLARLLLGKGFRDAAKKQFKKAGKTLKENIKVKITQPGPLKGKNVNLKDLRKLSISTEIKKQLRPIARRDRFPFAKVNPKTGRIVSMSDPKKLMKQTKDAKEIMNKLDKQIGNIEKKYVTKQAKGGLIRGLPKLAKRGF